MVNEQKHPKRDEPKRDEPKKVAVGCQGGGIHASFEVGVLCEILEAIEDQNRSKQNRFELVGLSGTSAGALCTLIVWYGLARKNGQAGSARAAIEQLEDFWVRCAATTTAERVLNLFTYSAFRAQEKEVLGFNAPLFGINPRSRISQAVTAGLPLLGVRGRYFDLDKLLGKACPHFKGIDWDNLQTRLLVGASEIMDGVETTFDSDCNMKDQGGKHTAATVNRHHWRKRLPLTLQGVAASGTLPQFREAEKIHGGCYWDGLYSQNPPIRELLSSVRKEHVPDEIWIVRINPQQCAQEPQSSAEIEDRENELMGNLSLNKELDFIMTVNDWITKYGGAFATDYKPVKVRTIKMRRQTAAELLYSSKFNRSRDFMDRLCKEGHEVAKEWLGLWPDVGCYPEDAAYS
jgi:NTE family protein